MTKAGLQRGTLKNMVSAYCTWPYWKIVNNEVVRKMHSPCDSFTPLTIRQPKSQSPFTVTGLIPLLNRVINLGFSWVIYHLKSKKKPLPSAGPCRALAQCSLASESIVTSHGRLVDAPLLPGSYDVMRRDLHTWDGMTGMTGMTGMSWRDCREPQFNTHTHTHIYIYIAIENDPCIGDVLMYLPQMVIFHRNVKNCPEAPGKQERNLGFGLKAL